MVEYTFSLDSTFAALADPTRRDILQRVSRGELSVGQLARFYDLTFAAVSKHLKVLEKACLIVKRKRGKQHMVSLAPQAFTDAAEYLDWYRRFMEGRLDALEIYLKEGQNG